MNNVNDFLARLDNVVWTSTDLQDVIRGKDRIGQEISISVGIKMNSLIGLPTELATDMTACVKMEGVTACRWTCESYEEQEDLVKWFKTTSSKALATSMRMDDLEKATAKMKFDKL
ncbi:MAG: hypothetical protein GY845_25545 [Planctomycetes bacterium]|nr:hypothetical protein [Planctomycetota bacterium]